MNATDLIKAKGNLETKVLICKEDDTYLAHALEMDLVSDGETEEEAINNLKRLISFQIVNAFIEQDLSMIYHPAPKEYFDAYYTLKLNNVFKIEFQVKKVKKGTFPISSREIEMPISEISKYASKHQGGLVAVCA
jgi:predicted RNase H-like HicB family nuclease